MKLLIFQTHTSDLALEFGLMENVLCSSENIKFKTSVSKAERRSIPSQNLFIFFRILN